MKVGVFAVLFKQRPFEEALDYIKQAGCETVEIGCGAYPGDAHCKPAELVDDGGARKRFVEAVISRGLEISALSCHGNPLHPNAAIAKDHDATFRATVRLAEQLGVATVITRARVWKRRMALAAAAPNVPTARPAARATAASTRELIPATAADVASPAPVASIASTADAPTARED